MSYPGSLEKDISCEVPIVEEVLKYVCEEKEDLIICFTLTTILLIMMGG